MTTKNNKQKATRTRPRILVLEGYSSMAANALRRAGADTVKINPPAVDAIEAALFKGFDLDDIAPGHDGEIDGLLLTGGGDVDPREYGEKPHRKVYGVNEMRDYCELLALDYAQQAGIPVLGICRGSQLMTVHNGGKLRQHIEGHRGVRHWHFAEPGSLFRKVIGSQEAKFESLHHQVVKRTGAGWRVAARDKDGHIEAVESRDGRCLGVQFHPELDTGTNEASRRIFRWLVLESAKRAGMKAPRRRKAPKGKPVKRSTKGSAKGSPQTLADRAKVRQLFPAGPPLPRPRTPVARRKPVGMDAAAMERNAERMRKQGVTVNYHCRSCGMRFDKLVDREDHETWLHGHGLIRRSEPPVGHPDWD